MPITAVVKIKTDDQFRMLTSELEEAINEDKRNNFQPFCIVATVGTTSMTSIDPIDRISQIARKYNLWGACRCLLTPARRQLLPNRPILSGIEDAHSMVVQIPTNGCLFQLI